MLNSRLYDSIVHKWVTKFPYDDHKYIYDFIGMNLF